MSSFAGGVKSTGLATAERESLPVCVHRGVECGGNEQDPLYLCEHPRVWVTNSARCSGCAYRTENQRLVLKNVPETTVSEIKENKAAWDGVAKRLDLCATADVSEQVSPGDKNVAPDITGHQPGNHRLSVVHTEQGLTQSSSPDRQPNRTLPDTNVSPPVSDFEDEDHRPSPVVPLPAPAPLLQRRGRKPPQPTDVWGPPQDPNLIVTREGKPAGLANVWLDQDLFLILSGPSLKALPLEQLQQRGVVTLAVNNAACVHRPTFWTHVDPAEKFHEAIWHDPGIIKLVPQRRFRQTLRTTQADGTLKPVPTRVADCPSVFGYKHGATFDPLTYLTCDFVCLGNNQKAHLKNGRPHNINVMFPLFRLAYYLGFRRVYLLGCDFKMARSGPIYAFDEGKDAGAVNSNNCAYLKLNQMLGELVRPLSKAGVQVYNCFRESGLRAFPFLSFEEAVNHATRNIPRTIHTSGWYEKSK